MFAPNEVNAMELLYCLMFSWKFRDVSGLLRVRRSFRSWGMVPMVVNVFYPDGNSCGFPLEIVVSGKRCIACPWRRWRMIGILVEIGGPRGVEDDCCVFDAMLACTQHWLLAGHSCLQLFLSFCCCRTWHKVRSCCGVFVGVMCF
jgi:hypothetical protein